MRPSKLAVFFVLIFSTTIFPAILSVDTTQQNEVNFLAKSTFGNVEGITHKISGYVKWQGEDTLQTSDIYFEVPLDSVDTGIGLRNKHMREKYLETEKYPKAIYKGKITSWTKDKADSNKFWVSSKGTLSIHGVEKSISVSGTLTKVNNLFHILYFFPLNIKDFNIGKPRFLLVSMDQNIHLKLDFYLKEQ